MNRDQRHCVKRKAEKLYTSFLESSCSSVSLSETCSTPIPTALVGASVSKPAAVVPTAAAVVPTAAALAPTTATPTSGTELEIEENSDGDDNASSGTDVELEHQDEVSKTKTIL